MVMVDVRAAIVERIRAVGQWRRERALYDPTVAADPRQRRSATGLDELANFIAGLPADDERLQALHRLAFQGDMFDPGASLLTELGRFRFFDVSEPTSGFVDRMVELAEFDRGEAGEFGGRQVAGDEPWRG